MNMITLRLNLIHTLVGHKNIFADGLVYSNRVSVMDTQAGNLTIPLAARYKVNLVRARKV